MENNTTEDININISNVDKNEGTKQIISAIIIVGIFIVGAILLRGSKPSYTTENTDSNIFSNLPIRPITAEDHILGDPNAQVFIVEYSDTECPYCKVFHNTMQNIVERSNGQVAWVYRHYPIAGLHPKAFHEAEATECAGEQGGNVAFWKYTNEIYDRTESNNKLPVEELPKIAAEIGLDVISFNTCLASGKFADKINADIDDGGEIGVQGTPSSFIVKNGKVVDTIHGAADFNTVKSKIEKILK